MRTSFPIATKFHGDLQVLDLPRTYLRTSVWTEWLTPLFPHLLPCLSYYTLNLKLVHIQQVQPGMPLTLFLPSSFKNTHLREIKFRPILTAIPSTKWWDYSRLFCERLWFRLTFCEIQIHIKRGAWLQLDNLIMIRVAPLTASWATHSGNPLSNISFFTPH